MPEPTDSSLENPSNQFSADVLLVGGGLANGLIALTLKQRRPELTFLILEGERKLGGEHTWSFHSSDMTQAQREWLAPVIARSWPTYRAIFPEYERTLTGGYHSVTSQQFHEVLTRELGDACLLGKRVRTLTPSHIQLEDGTLLRGRCVIDGRGFDEKARLIAGYQKFLGMDLRLEAPHGEKDPILMDGRVPQKDGLRFFYTLPWSDTRIQLGEARFSDSCEVKREEFRAAILEYARGRGWKVAEVEREEVGVLPAPLEGDVGDLLSQGARVTGVPCVGVRAGFFHATTGYSLPYAVRFAEALAELPLITNPAVLELSQSCSFQEWRRARYFRLLNRMLFRAAEPEERFKMFQQFYRRNEGLIQRFYYGRLRTSDYLRIMTGKPPVSLRRAMNVFLGKA